MSKFNIGDTVRASKFYKHSERELWEGSTVTELRPDSRFAVKVCRKDGVTGLFSDKELESAKVRTLKGYCKAIYDVLKASEGKPVQSTLLDHACACTSRGVTMSTDATGARIRDLRKPIYGGHKIVYDRKADTYTLLAA